MAYPERKQRQYRKDQRTGSALASPRQVADADAERGPTRRCLVTQAILPKAELLRFVIDPEGRLVADVAGRLPGRGFWICPHRAVLEEALARKAFSRAARRPVQIDESFWQRLDAGLRGYCLETLGLLRRAGLAIGGFMKAKELIQQGRARALIAASDAEDKEKWRSLAPQLPFFDEWSRDELGALFGREQIVYIGLASGSLTERWLQSAQSLALLRQ